MGATMPFSKHNIDPEYIEAMRAAFHRVCDALQLNCHADDPMTEIVVMKIVELANAGELDPRGYASPWWLAWRHGQVPPQARQRLRRGRT
jgi:hypothetical protein